MLERLNFDNSQMLKTFESELSDLRLTRANLEGIANKGLEDQNFMYTKTGEGSNKILDPQQYESLTKAIEELYKGVSEVRNDKGVIECKIT